MGANTPLWKAHDISEQLQDRIEVLPNVERAFVHVDHETTHIPVSLATWSSRFRPECRHVGTSKNNLIHMFLLWNSHVHCIRHQASRLVHSDWTQGKICT